MTKILNVNDLCDAIKDSELSDGTKQVPISKLETSVALAARVLADRRRVASTLEVENEIA